MKINVVLVEPEIPQNTGNIARTCAAIGAKLHLVRPLGFEITEKQVKRAGLDYWDKVEIEEHDSFKEFLNKYKPEENCMYFVTTKGKNVYSDIDVSREKEVFVLFGKETKGLPEDVLQKYLDKTMRIPMRETLRSLNLSNSVAIVAYDLFRQSKFEGLERISGYFDDKNI
ncbi:MAG: tRNA (uridine(34)/cytosine(34)/5-carboxymethylaminomethyluridine(34)-2'-O)-methyltransferase TrmL [Clostridia bacterium]|nr:tRNA (uridine(34)/cytosine(34)/5-carboxymethylaminomethyluridine(34)-2'-O)-methyltransferase TrmL [Clostridia bacterium]